MTAALLALLAAGMYGTGDFLGGLAGRRAPLLAITVGALATGVVWLATTVWWITPTVPPLRDLGIGALGGLFGSIGVTLLYRSLALGTMSVVAPICAMASIAGPVIFGVALGERPSGIAWAGVVLAVVAVALCGQETRAPTASAMAPGRQPAVMALFAGLAIGGFLIAIDRTSHESGAWPVLAARLTSTAIVAIAAVARRAPLRVPRPVLPLVIGSGIIDTSSNVVYQMAVRHGYLSTVATLVSLYPAATVVLARVVLKERLSGVQVVGMIVAAAAAVMISLG